MRSIKKITVGTRGSRLALVQTEAVIGYLKEKHPGFEFIIKKITTTGDRVNGWQSTRIDKAIFVKEIEEALIDKEIDLAVHSVKDLPCDLACGLALAAVTERLKAHDALISRDGSGLAKLKNGARIGTSSLRRQAQLLHWRGDLVVKDLRGNLDTRIKKLKSGEFDAIVVAAAGLARMGWQEMVSEYIPPEILLPCPGQGALGIETRQEDAEVKEAVSALNHAQTDCCISAERAFLKRLGGGCRVPVGALAELEAGNLLLRAVVISPDGSAMARSEGARGCDEAQALGEDVADKLLAMGAKEILEKARDYVGD